MSDEKAAPDEFDERAAAFLSDLAGRSWDDPKVLARFLREIAWATSQGRATTVVNNFAERAPLPDAPEDAELVALIEGQKGTTAGLLSVGPDYTHASSHSVALLDWEGAPVATVGRREIASVLAECWNNLQRIGEALLVERRERRGAQERVASLVKSLRELRQRQGNGAGA